MKKNIYISFIFLFLVTSCQRHEVVKTHGISYLEKREKLIIVNKSNKNDAVKVLGQPATKGMTDNNLWIYIERTQTRGKLLKFGRNYLKKNNVLVLEINEMGLLAKKDFIDINKMNSIEYSNKTTSGAYTKDSFVYSFLSSMRQKLNDPLGKRRKTK